MRTDQFAFEPWFETGSSRLHPFPCLQSVVNPSSLS